MSHSNLGNFGTFIRGKGIPKGHVINGDGLPCIRYAEIYTSYDETADNLISRISEENSRDALKIGYGDIIFPTSGETAEEIGKAVAYLGSETAYAGGDTLVLRDHEQNPAYLAYALNEWQAVKQKARLATGQSVVHIYAAELGQVSIWLPPLAEQERIVEILSDADAAISTAEKQLEAFSLSQKHQHNRLIAEIADAFGTKTVSDIADISIGSSKASVLCEKGNFLVLDMGGVSEDGDLISQKFTDRNEDLLSLGDIIVPKDDIGDGLIIGKAGIVDSDNRYVLGDHVFKLSADNIHPRYLQAAINSTHFRRQVLRIATGSAQLGINQANFVKLQVAAPTDEKQHVVASIYENTKTAEKIMVDRIDTLKKQKRGLMQQLLTGKLRVPEKG